MEEVIGVRHQKYLPVGAVLNDEQLSGRMQSALITSEGYAGKPKVFSANRNHQETPKGGGLKSALRFAVRHSEFIHRRWLHQSAAG